VVLERNGCVESAKCAPVNPLDYPGATRFCYESITDDFEWSPKHSRVSHASIGGHHGRAISPGVFARMIPYELLEICRYCKRVWSLSAILKK
jgi:hypothetical protein